MRETFRAIEVLHWYQKYRRGSISYEELQKHASNEEIGKAIDFAISELRAIRNYQLDPSDVIELKRG